MEHSACAAAASFADISHAADAGHGAAALDGARALHAPHPPRSRRAVRPASAGRRRFVATGFVALAASVTASSLALVGPTPARAQALRTIPPKAVPGIIELKNFPDAVIDGNAVRLSAGARIHDLDNRIVMPASLAGARHRVLYTRDGSGLVDRVWFATDAEFEAAQAKRR